MKAESVSARFGCHPSLATLSIDSGSTASRNVNAESPALLFRLAPFALARAGHRSSSLDCDDELTDGNAAGKRLIL